MDNMDQLVQWLLVLGVFDMVGKEFVHSYHVISMFICTNFHFGGVNGTSLVEAG